MTTRARIAVVLASLSAAALIIVAAGRLQAYPKPALVATAWQLDYTVQEPRPIAVQDSYGEYHWYWYLPYKVVNNTGQDRAFLPDFAIATDEGDVLNAAHYVPPEVYEEVKRHLNNKYLEAPTHIVGKLLQGETNARESVAIWAAPDHPVLHMSVFVAGLSGENKSITDPVTGKSVLLVKTLMLDFETPGKPPVLKYQPVVAKGQSWIMR